MRGYFPCVSTGEVYTYTPTFLNLKSEWQLLIDIFIVLGNGNSHIVLPIRDPKYNSNRKT